MTGDDVGDERVRLLDLGEIRRVRRRGRSEALDRRDEVAVGKVDARDPGAGGDERLGTGEADSRAAPR